MLSSGDFFAMKLRCEPQSDGGADVTSATDALQSEQITVGRRDQLRRSDM